jgi:DNA-binding NarL/FixJ family response regulator
MSHETAHISQPRYQLTHDTDPVAVSIVSNNQLLRQGLLALLAKQMDLRIVGSYSGELCAISDLPNPLGHLVLLDGSLGQETAVNWIQLWRALIPPPDVIVVELVNNTELILACIEVGAGGYTLEGASVNDVAEAIDAMRQGIALCSPEITAQLFAHVAALHAVLLPGIDPNVPLTARELEVLRYIVADCSNQEIARILVIEVSTVKHHVHNILEKLSVRHRWEAARLATEHGWVVVGQVVSPVKE